MHSISARFELCRTGVITLKRRPVGVERIAIRLDHDSLYRPEKVGQVTLDHNVYLRQWKASPSAESEKIDLQRRNGVGRPGINLERRPSQATRSRSPRCPFDESAQLRPS